MSQVSILERLVVEGQRPASTKRLYVWVVRDFVRFAGANPAAWSLITVEHWRDAARRRGVAASTVNTRVQALRYAARRYAQRYDQPNFTQGVELLRTAPTKRHAIDEESARRLVEMTERDRSPLGTRDVAILIVGLRTGLRLAELAQVPMVTARQRVFTVRQKGGGPLQVVLDDEASEALTTWSAWLRRQGIEGRAFRALRPSLRTEATLKQTHAVAGPLSDNGLWRVVARRGQAAGLEITTHTLRHTFMSVALAAGMPPERVASTMGHRRLDQVMRYYTDLAAERDPVASNLPSFRRR